MDKNVKDVILKRINRTSENLLKNNMEVYYASTKEDVPEIVEGLLNDGDVVANGGSMTMKECNLAELLNSGKYKYLDRDAIDHSEVKNLYRASFSADAYITSANAITENGCLYNVDGNSNRIAAIAYGPDKVIVIAGYNKIVPTLEDAVKRVKCESAPANCQRLESGTYCYKTGQCISMKNPDSILTDGCPSEDRICCNYLISAYQSVKGRIKVILVGEILGY